MIITQEENQHIIRTETEITILMADSEFWYGIQTIPRGITYCGKPVINQEFENKDEAEQYIINNNLTKYEPPEDEIYLF